MKLQISGNMTPRAIHPTRIPPGILGWFHWSRSMMLGLQRVNTPGQSAMRLFSKHSNVCDHNTSLLQRDGQTDKLSWQYHSLLSTARQKRTELHWNAYM